MSSSPAHSIAASSGRARLDEVQADLVMRAVELRHRQRDQRRVRGRERADPQPAAVEARERLELVLGGGEPVEDHVGVLDQQLAGRGQPDAARAALDQPGPGLGLERRDLARDGGLGERERVSGGRERAVGGDLAQDAQAADVKHAASVYLIVRKII